MVYLYQIINYIPSENIKWIKKNVMEIKLHCSLKVENTDILIKNIITFQCEFVTDANLNDETYKKFFGEIESSDSLININRNISTVIKECQFIESSKENDLKDIPVDSRPFRTKLSRIQIKIHQKEIKKNIYNGTKKSNTEPNNQILLYQMLKYENNNKTEKNANIQMITRIFPKANWEMGTLLNGDYVLADTSGNYIKVFVTKKTVKCNGKDCAHYFCDNKSDYELIQVRPFTLTAIPIGINLDGIYYEIINGVQTNSIEFIRGMATSESDLTYVDNLYKYEQIIARAINFNYNEIMMLFNKNPEIQALDIFHGDKMDEHNDYSNRFLV